MIEFITEAQVDDQTHGYYRGRWAYYRQAVEFIQTIPGWKQLLPWNVLEIGPALVPIVQECDVLDLNDYWLERTLVHDATITPWPIEDDRYVLAVALQVWEHLGTAQKEAFDEVKRVSRWAILSVPYKWPESCGDHGSIDESRLRQWTGLEPVRSQVVACSEIDGLPRIVCLYQC